MSEFVARWSTWEPQAVGSETPSQGTSKNSKTSKTPIGGAETPSQGTSKTSKTPFAGFAGSLPGHMGESAGSVGEPLEQAETPLTPGVTAAMDLGEFARAGLVVRIHSAVLGCEVLFVSDDVNDADLQDCGLPIYSAAELRKLAIARPRPRELLRIHDVKTIFDGAIDNARPRDDHARQEA